MPIPVKHITAREIIADFLKDRSKYAYSFEEIFRCEQLTLTEQDLKLITFAQHKSRVFQDLLDLVRTGKVQQGISGKSEHDFTIYFLYGGA